MSTLYVPNIRLAALFELEIKGQLSDGHWENTRPYNHWEPWCEATAAVSRHIEGRDFYANKDNYQLTATDLLAAVGERMMVYVKLAEAFGVKNAELLEYCFDLDGKFCGIPKYGGDTWTAIRNDLAKFDMVKVKEVVAETSYVMADLKRDLRELKRLMKVEKVAI